MELSQKLPGAATVKESLTTAEARQANAEEISELAWIEKQLEQKKEYRIIRG